MSQASVLVPESRLAQAALSESNPTALPPFSLTLDQFSAEVVSVEAFGKGNLELSFVPGSLEWVRVNDVLVVPRARLRVRARESGGVAVEVEHAGFVQSGVSEVITPVALLSGEENRLGVKLRLNGAVRAGVVAIRFKSPTGINSPAAPIGTDLSCSRFGLSLMPDGASHVSGWVFAGCRLVEVKDRNGEVASLEVYLLWDGLPGIASLHFLRVGPESGQTVVSAGPERLRLSYKLPSRIHHGFLGAGIGPYQVRFEGGGDLTEGWTAMPTLYGAYSFTETMRLVAFDAVTLNQHLPTDLGFYFSTEQARVLDRRFSINLMLGAHFTGFRSRGQYSLLLGAPQGFEIIGYDVLRRNHNLVLGAFIYPEISGKEYYNFWLRWGSPALFGEFNYISWKEKVDEVPFQSKSIGLSIGFPVARFF